MRAVEDLLGAVQDPTSCRYLREAVNVYNAGAFRAAIVATWIAVSVDLISKIRDLSNTDDGAAVQYINDLESYISHSQRDKLQTIERQLLDEAHTKFEFIDQRELTELQRLQADRHICAHPAFVSSDELFNASPELARAHISAAVDSVLSRHASPGKKAIERFMSELHHDTLPKRFEDLVEYLRERFFQRGKSSLRRNLARVMVKTCICPPDDNKALAKRAAPCVKAAMTIDPDLMANALSHEIGKRESENGLREIEALLFVGMLGDLEAAWNSLPSSSLPRIETVIESADIHQLVVCGVMGCAVSGPVGPVTLKRIKDLDSTQLAMVIRERPDLIFVDSALIAFEDSRSFRSAEANMKGMIMPIAPALTEEHIRRVITSVKTNNQIHLASEMPILMVEFFHATIERFVSCFSDWRDLCDWLERSRNGDGTDYYTYPELREAIEKTPPF